MTIDGAMVREQSYIHHMRICEFATVKHRDGRKYHLLATVERTPGAVGNGTNTPKGKQP